LEITGIATPTRTGLFEVQIVGGKLAWSKKETSKFPTAKDDLDKVFLCVKEALAA
jgi:selT/selW/selH-like putative selenoprotein